MEQHLLGRTGEGPQPETAAIIYPPQMLLDPLGFSTNSFPASDSKVSSHLCLHWQLRPLVPGPPFNSNAAGLSQDHGAHAPQPAFPAGEHTAHGNLEPV